MCRHIGGGGQGHEIVCVRSVDGVHQDVCGDVPWSHHFGVVGCSVGVGALGLGFYPRDIGVAPLGILIPKLLVVVVAACRLE